MPLTLYLCYGFVVQLKIYCIYYKNLKAFYSYYLKACEIHKGQIAKSKALLAQRKRHYRSGEDTNFYPLCQQAIIGVSLKPYKIVPYNNH